MSLNLRNIIVDRLGIQTLREFTQKYTPQELVGVRWWNPKATTELNKLFKENNQPPYII